MASSDSDEFASADEAASTEGSERRRRSKRTSSSNYDSEDGATGKHGIDLAQRSQETPVKPAAAVSTPAKQTEGWDDFDIEDVEPKVIQTSSPIRPKVASPSEKSTEVPASDAVLRGSPDVSLVKSGDQNAGDGWDKFDDWGQGDEASGKTDHVPKPTSSPEEDRIKSVADRLSGLSVGGREATGGGWGWNSWAVDSLLSTASAGISTLTSTVSQGLTTVSNVLESGIGAPEPEELAKRTLETIEERSERSETSPPDSARTEAAPGRQTPDETTAHEGAFAFGNFMSGVSHLTKFVESTGSKVITGGLDTLETIGKKTMEVLQDGDPGLARKRALLGLDSGERPALSQLLREARTQADEEDRIREQKREAKEVHYETLFDDFEGLVHLEALEMLSRQVGMRLEERLRSLQPDKRQEMKETMQQVAELCELPEEEEDEEESTDGDLTAPETLHNRLREATQDLGLPLQFQPLIKQAEAVASWLASETAAPERAVYKRAVGGLAQCTALAVEVYHRAAELLLVKARRSTADEADALAQMTSVLTRHVGKLATDFTARLSQLGADENADQINTYITNVFLEAGNSATYIQNAFHLTLPILQIGAA